jgi:hypothetical protein
VLTWLAGSGSGARGSERRTAAPGRLSPSGERIQAAARGFSGEDQALGRTVPTYRMTLEGEAARFGEFRRALRARERGAFDRIIDRARAQSSAASYGAALDPDEVMFLSILLDQELAIMKLEAALDELAWAVMGRPAGAAESLDAFAPRSSGGSPHSGPI